MAVYVANKAGRWDALDTWLTSSRPWSEITTTASGWVTATTAPTLVDDVYANGNIVTFSSASGYVHSTRLLTCKPVIINASVLVVRSTGGGFKPDKHAWVYYISSSVIDSGYSTGANVSSQNISIETSQSIFYISSSIYNTGNQSINSIATPTIYITTGMHSSSIYIVGNVYGGGGNIGTVGQVVTANRCNIIITGSVYGGTDSTGVAGAGIYIGTGTFTSCSISGSVYATTGGPGIFAVATGTGSYIQVNGNVVASHATPAISSSVLAGSTHSINIFGNIINHPTTAQQAVVGSRVYLTGSSVSSVQVKSYPNSNIALYDSSTTPDNTPAIANVYKGVVYGNNKTGVLTTPNVSDVRSIITYYTGSVGSTPTSQPGQCYMPHSSSVRFGAPSYDSASTPGAMVVPIQTQVQYGVFFSTGSLTGSYQSTSQYWSTSSNSFTQVSSSGYLLSRSLDTTLGSITSSFVADLNNVNTTSNTIRRMQNVHTTQSVSQSIGSYA